MNHMRVYLINPPVSFGVRQVREGRCMQRSGAWTSIWTPLSLAYCASVMREDGMGVNLTDCIAEGMNMDNLIKKVTDFNPDLVVINTATPSIETDLKTAGIIKNALPDVLTAAIGIHPTSLPESCLKDYHGLDFCIRREPEYTALYLARAIAANKNINDINGISFKRGGQIINNPDRRYIRDLDSLPFPAWDLIDLDRYRMPFSGERFLLLATSRGCPYRCRFCSERSYYGSKLRARSPPEVIREIEWNTDNHGIDSFLFWSESFTLARPYVYEICDSIIGRGLNIKWVCNSRVDSVSPDMLDLLKRAGCWMIGFGVESANQHVLDAMNKGITVKQIRDALKWSKDAGLEVTAHCMIGYPGESSSDIKNTLELVKELEVDFAQFYCTVPFPGSELYMTAIEDNRIVNSDWSKFEQKYSVLATPQLTAHDVMGLRRMAYLKFYLRPSMIYRTIKRLRKPSQIKNLLLMLRDFFTWI